MNAIANNIRISELPYYCKSSCSRHPLPELNCHWSSEHRSYPFILAITGNIATAETFPFNRKEFRRTGKVYTFTRRARYHHDTYLGRTTLEFSFEILEKVVTGEQFAIIRDVVRNGRCY